MARRGTTTRPSEARLSLSCHRHPTLYSLPLPAYRYAPRQCQED